MKYLTLLSITLTSFLGFASSATAQQPINYQGRVTVGGVNFTGTGRFKFVLIEDSAQAQAVVGTLTNAAVGSLILQRGGSGYLSTPSVTLIGGGGTGAAAAAHLTGGVVTSITLDSGGSGYTSFPGIMIGAPPTPVYTTRWSNDASSVGGSEPAAAVSVPVANGLYSVGLGNISLANMGPIPPYIFSSLPMKLRIWFSDGASGFQLLTPDQPLAAVPYAAQAETSAYSHYAQTAGFALSGGGVIPNGHQEFAPVGAHEFTVPPGVFRIMVEAWGAGGGGGGGYSGSYPDPNGIVFGGGGGSGAYSRSLLDVIPGQLFDVIIGAGGNGGNAGYSRDLSYFNGTSGSDGEATEFKISPLRGTGPQVTSGGGKGGGGGKVTPTVYGAGGEGGLPAPNAVIGRTQSGYLGASYADHGGTQGGLAFTQVPVGPPFGTGNGGLGEAKKGEKGGDGYLLITW